MLHGLRLKNLLVVGSNAAIERFERHYAEMTFPVIYQQPHSLYCGLLSLVLIQYALQLSMISCALQTLR